MMTYAANYFDRDECNPDAESEKRWIELDVTDRFAAVAAVAPISNDEEIVEFNADGDAVARYVNGRWWEGA